MQSIYLRALCGISALALIALVPAVQADDAATQTAALGNAASATVPANQLPIAPRTFVLASAVEDGALSSRDESALKGVIAAIQDSRPMLVSVTGIGTPSGETLDRADAVRAWLVARGVDESSITMAARDQAGAMPSEVSLQDGQVRISLVE